MGHLGEQNLQRLKTLSTGMDPPPDDCVCVPCVQGRMKEKPHKRKFKPGTYPLEFIHTNIASPFPVTGYNQSRYWVTFLDDYIQIAEAYPITERSEFFRCFQRFIEKYSRPERRCRRVRLDWGGENRLDEFHIFCADRGIDVEVTATEQHQQNGAAERLNRILMDKLHPTLLNANLHKKWWPEILISIVKIRNRSPSARIGKTPYEAWYGEKPDLSFIRVLGCDCLVLKPEQKRRKLADIKTMPCKLLGFEGSQNYRVLIENGTITRSTNVIFMEKDLT